MAVIYFIIIFLGILAVGLAINKPFRQQLNLKFHGRTDTIMAENAATPEGAEDIFRAAIQEKENNFHQINDLYSAAEGHLDALESDEYTVYGKLNNAQNSMDRCLDKGNDEDAKYYAAQKVSLEEQLEIIKRSIEDAKVDVAQKKELKTKVFEELQALKNEKDVTIQQLKSDQARLEAARSLEGITNSETDRMIEKVREGAKKKKEMANGARISYENSAEAAEYRMQQRERESEIDRVLAEAKARRKENKK